MRFLSTKSEAASFPDVAKSEHGMLPIFSAAGIELVSRRETLFRHNIRWCREANVPPLLLSDIGDSGHLCR